MGQLPLNMKIEERLGLLPFGPPDRASYLDERAGPDIFQ
jgi:hypothetical protein